MKKKTIHNKKNYKPNILDALIVSIVDPKGTASRLIKPNDYPPYSITLLLTFLAVFILPPLLYGQIFYDTGIDSKRTGSIIISTTITIALTVGLLFFTTHACNVKKPFGKVLSAVAYCTAPIIAIFASLLIANKALMGSLTLLTFISNGIFMPQDIITQIFPFALRVSVMAALFNLSQGLAAAARGGFGLGLVLAFLSIPIILGSFIMSLWLTELIYPMSSSETISFFANIMAYPT
jgi:hypothetical protein